MNLVEIEAALRSMEEHISEAVVLVARRDETQQTIVAFCQPHILSSKQKTHIFSINIKMQDPKRARS